MRHFWFMAVIDCAEGDWIAIAMHLLQDTLRELRRSLLGETENARLEICEGEPVVILVVHLSQNRWHKLARLLTRRASFYRKLLQLRPGRVELYPNAVLDSGKKASVDTEASDSLTLLTRQSRRL
jgi:hypothetical protein